MAKDFSTMEDSNRSGNATIHEVLAQRRAVLQLAGVSALAALLQPLSGCATAAPGAGSAAAASAGPRLGFAAIPPGMGDALHVPEGYVAQVIAAWGEPIGVPGQMPASMRNAGIWPGTPMGSPQAAITCAT